MDEYIVKYTLKNFEELFKNKYFVIPDYQRGYTWDDKQLSDFFNDIVEVESSEHYSGTITLSKLSQNNNDETYTIIDGQQRITTTIIFLQCICEELKKLNEEKYANIIKKIQDTYIYDDDKKRYRFEYQNSDLSGANPNGAFFRMKILNRDEFDREPEKSFYTLKLSHAKEFFANIFTNELGKYPKQPNNNHNNDDDDDDDDDFDKDVDSKPDNNITSIDKGEELCKLVEYLTKNFKINEYILDDKMFNVHVVFESMNNRGKALSSLELLKNRFLFLIEIIEDFNLNENHKKYAINKINASYNTIYNNLGKNEKKPLNDDDFLRIHWISYHEFTYSRAEGKSYAKDLLNKIFIKKAIKNKTLTWDYIEKYVEDLAINSKYYHILYNPQDLLHNKKETQEDKELVLYLKRLNKLWFYDFTPLIMKSLKLYDRADIAGKKEIINLLKLIEKFMFITFGLCEYPTAYRQKEIYQQAKNLQSKDNIAQVIQYLKDIMLVGHPRSTEGAYFENKLNIAHFKIYNKFKGNFYKWGYVKYLLYEYEYHLHTKTNQTYEFIYTIEEKKAWIDKEHIVPQTANMDREKYFNGIDDKTYTKQINCLGNILLLNEADNSALQNKNFVAKKEIYEKDSKSSKDVANKSKWDFEEIIARGEKILTFANTRWDLKLTDENIKAIANGEFFD